MRLIVLWSSVILFAIAATFASGGEISLSSGVDKTDIPFEDSVNLAIMVKWRGDIQQYSFELLPLPETRNLKVIGTSSSISSATEQGQEYTTRAFKYVLRPTGSGVGVVEPIVLKYVAWPDSIPGELSTQRFEVLIAAPLPMPEKSNLPRAVLIIAVTAVLGAAIVIFILIRRRTPVLPPQKLAEEQFLEGLELTKKESQSDRKVFFTRLYKLLVNYIEAKYGIEASGKTNQMVLAALETSQFPVEQKEKFSGWLALADKEKFAPSAGTPGDIIRLYTEIESFMSKYITSNKSEEK